MSGAYPASEVLDRIVASVGDAAITQSDVEVTYRLELFLNGHSPAGTPDRETFVKIRHRLVSQELLSQEAEAQQVNPVAVSQRVEEEWTEVQKKFADEKRFQAALQQIGLSREQILERLAQQERTLILIDQRLRPAAWVERSEIEAYYEQEFSPRYRERHSHEPPPLPEVESAIREILVQKKIDELLAAWLEELRSVRRVIIH